MTFSATYFGSSGWLIEFGNFRVLIDPWLKGSLRFAPGDWFLKGEHKKPWSIPENKSLIILTQGLSDHAHPETLEIIPKDVCVIGSQEAAKVAEKIGWEKAQ